MTDVSSKFTVYFEDPFWVGVYERECRGRYEVCKITFGAEPKDREVYAFLLENRRFLKFSRPVGVRRSAEKRVGPKRMQREIERQLRRPGTGTKAQQALQAARECGKTERRIRTREQREQEAQRQYDLRRQKQKEKRRGH